MRYMENNVRIELEYDVLNTSLRNCCSSRRELRKRAKGYWVIGLAATLVVASAFGQVPITAELSVDRQNIYVGEMFNLTISIDATGAQLFPEMSIVGMPDKSILETGRYEELQPQRKVMDNQVRDYRRFLCRARALSPGTMDLSPTLKVQIVIRERSFIGFSEARTPADIRVAPLTLNISPIPDVGRPADFSGAIGQFTFDVDVAPRDVAVGDLVTVTMRIGGDGNTEKMTPPRVAAAKDFKLYEPESLDENGGRNVRAFKQVVIPQSTNAVAIPAVSFSYFDPRAGTYKRITKGPSILAFHGQKTVMFEQYRPGQAASATEGPRTTGVTSAVKGGASSPIVAKWWRAITSREKRAVSVRSDTAMFAPSHLSMASFDVPGGAVVTVFETSGNWSKIALGEKRGWFPTSALKE
jgi:hypothetical protein